MRRPPEPLIPKLGLVTLLLVLCGVLCVPGLLAPYSPHALDSPYLGPCRFHLLGTNGIGQDNLSLLLFSARTSLLVGAVTAFLTGFLGVLVGLVSGYHRGVRDEILMRGTDLFMMLPGLPLIILLAAYCNLGVWGIIFILALISWPSTARVVRSSVLPIREAGFARNIKGLGAGPFYVMTRHILPNIRDIVIGKTMLAAAGAMAAEGGVSFLGLSDPETLTWGVMIHDAFKGGALVNGYYWWYLPPVGCISATVLALTLLGQRVGADDASAPWPRLRGPSTCGPSVAPGDGECLSVQDLAVDFVGRNGAPQRVVRDVSLTLLDGERLAVVGQTGAGKSVLLTAILGLLPENAFVSGAVHYHGTPLLGLPERALLRFRGREIGYVPQGAGNALNPLLSVGYQIAEPSRLHLGLGTSDATARSLALLARTGVEQPGEWVRKYPHHLSGGMRQRVLLAMAMAPEPPLLLLDEPTKGLDPEGRNEVLGALVNLPSTSVVMVTHDLWLAQRFASKAAVVYGGIIVEMGPAEPLFRSPLHPYSKALVAALPERGMEVLTRRGEVEDMDKDTGCPFRPHCAEAFEKCREMPPVTERGRSCIRCWRYAL